MKAFEKLSDIELLTLVIYGEARNQGLDGMLAVGQVVMNRVRKRSWYGHDVKSVILRKWQFSCFNEGDPNRGILENLAQDFGSHMDMATFSACHWLAKGILEGHLSSAAMRNDVGPATHYHTRRVSPAWKDKLRQITQVGDHLFYEEV